MKNEHMDYYRDSQISQLVPASQPVPIEASPPPPPIGVSPPPPPPPPPLPPAIVPAAVTIQASGTAVPVPATEAPTLAPGKILPKRWKRAGRHPWRGGRGGLHYTINHIYY
ncbi:WAS/WASL-interacting protein family member 3-like [Ooceraea biroi]|uniref:WAS/WASL-interacting protein family member 3-like n=1 Tax=Ooceraea biroi TaxID=2015173 RepID=UPI000F099A23|nr:WAS/WASL-interacting protein family member 3-like [Ooceraea biroi]